MNISKRRKIIFVSLVLLSVFILYNLYRSYYVIQKSYHILENEKTESEVKFIVICDIHDHVFGKDNEILIDNIIQENPDGILMVGDMINQDSKSINHITELIKKLRDFAPIYYAMGNHELQWEKIHDSNLRELLTMSGAIVLDKLYCDIMLNEQHIRIGGLYDYAFNFGDLDDPLNEKRSIYNYLVEFQNTDAYKIMLAHKPDSFIFSDASERWDIDLVISGHLHGGQIVIPFLGGLYAGDQGFFPKYIHGMYEKNNMNILISSGLSTNKKVLPRWNNPPEIIVLQLQ